LRLPLQHLESYPILAILRGVRPEEVVDIGAALIKSGVRTIEVPLNSPEPLKSIRLLRDSFGESCLCGAGTVLEPREVNAVYEAGGRLIVSPNTDVAVIQRALELGMSVMPGFATATEAFTALAVGAHFLKLFPASTYGPAHLRALRAVLPDTTKICAVGGVGVQTMAPWIDAGIDGIGVGTELYRPGSTPSDVGRRAAALVTAFRSATRA
jgi:2-dehydro-3-deoxyphosphogalactonate aldolase